MAAETSTDAREGELSLGRLEAFSDGVFAIAITLMVLDLAVGADAGDHLLRSILDEWPSYLAYVTSFLTIGAVWLQHSTVTGVLRAADGSLYRINLLVLLLASFLPFPTKLAAEYLDDEHSEKVAVVFYGIVLMALVLALTWFARYALKDQRLLRDDADLSMVDAEGARRPAYRLYVIGIVVSVLAPTAAVWIYLISALKRGLPVGALSSLLPRRRPGGRASG
jgi:uncharacterized membrane protein